MAKNSDLITEANGLAAQLGETVDTEGLTNAQLVKLVKDLKAKLDSAETAAAPAPAETAASVEIKGAACCVSSGSSVTAKGHRVLGPGDDVEPSDLAGGSEAFEALLKKGVISRKAS